MDRDELLRALRELSERLRSPCEIVIVGGAAMILCYGASRATHDVDVLLLSGNTTEVRRIARQVAGEYNLPEDWLNDAVKGYADILPPDFRERLYLLGSFNQVTLYALGLPEQAAMKIVALRDQDLEDLELLMPRLQESDKAVIRQIVTQVARMRPDWAQRLRYFLMEQGWKLE